MPTVMVRCAYCVEPFLLRYPIVEDHCPACKFPWGKFTVEFRASASVTQSGELLRQVGERAS